MSGFAGLADAFPVTEQSADANTDINDEEAIRSADEKAKEGREHANKGDVTQACALFEEALQIRAEHFGQLGAETADAYIDYASSLLECYRAQSDIFGSAVEQNVDERANAALSAVAKEDEVAAKAGTQGEAEGEDQQGEEEGEDAEEGEEEGNGGADDLLEVSWRGAWKRLEHLPLGCHSISLHLPLIDCR